MLQLLSDHSADVDARVSGDDRVVDAAEEGDACIKAVGYPAVEDSSPRANVAMAGDGIITAYRVGAASEEEALESLGELVPIEAAMAECSAAYFEVADQVTVRRGRRCSKRIPGSSRRSMSRCRTKPSCTMSTSTGNDHAIDQDRPARFATNPALAVLGLLAMATATRRRTRLRFG